MTDEFWSAIEQRPWHGNVRELRNAIDHAVVLSRGGPLVAEHLPASLTMSGTDAATGPQLATAIADWVRQQLAVPEAERSDDLYRRFLSVSESALFDEILNYTQQNRSAAAKLLGVDRATLRSKLGTGTP